MGLLFDLLERARQYRSLRIAQLQGQNFQTPRRYSFVGASGSARKTPLFGSEMGAFGEDWAYRVASPVMPQGVLREGVPSRIVNRGGSTVDLHAENLSRAFEDPATSRSFKITSQDTDQTPVGHGGGSPISRWDGIVRNNPDKPSFVSSRRSREETPADRHARDLASWNFDFSQ